MRNEQDNGNFCGFSLEIRKKHCIFALASDQNQDHLLSSVLPNHNMTMTRSTLLIIIGIILSCLNISAQEKYIMHSSQLVLSCGESNRAQILNRTDSRATKLTLQKRTDGKWNIVKTNSNGEQLYLSKNGSWNTYFEQDSESSNAIWQIEDIGSYSKIKCTANNLYLGTDDTKSGSNVYCDKNGNDAKHQWYLADVSTQAPKADTLTYVVNPASRRQVTEGWGVSLCWWARMCGAWSDSQIDKLVDWLVSPTGLNFNIFRYNIGGGDDPQNAHCTKHHMGNGKGLRAEMEGFQDKRGGDFIWTRDEGQRKIMLKIKEKRPDAIFEAFSNSCPWWMTYSGCCSGNVEGGKDNLKPEYYEDFAKYLVEVCKHYKEEYGIEFRTLEPFNESMTGYWSANGGQEGCHFDVQSQINFIKVLYPILQKSGLNTVISASDETSVHNGLDALRSYKNAGIIKMIGQWNTHTYGADDNTRAKVGALSRSLGIRQWMSEVGSGGSGLAGNLNMAMKLMDDIRYMVPDAWIDWQYVEENNDQWCMVKASFSNPSSATRVKNYYVRQHFSRFIPAGYRFVSSLHRNTLCALSPDEKEMVLVAVNPTAMKAYHRAKLRFCEADGSKIKGYYTTESTNMTSFKSFKLNEDGQLDITMPAMSIVTLVIPVDHVAELNKDGMPGKAVIIAQPNNYLALTATTSKVTAEDARYDSRQIWDLIDNGDGTYKLMNQDSLYLTYSSSSYALSAKTKKSGTQAFVFDPIDDYFHRIKVNRTTKYLDLQNGALSSGTTVGTYTYSSGEDVGKHWMVVGIDAVKEDSGDGINETTASAESSDIYAIYDINGRRIQNTNVQKGIHIVKMRDGSTRTIMVR